MYLSRWSLPPTTTFRGFVLRALEAGTTENGVFAAKIHWFQFEQLLGQLRTMPGSAGVSSAELLARQFPNPRYVYLAREDKVRQAISYYRALQSDVWWKVGSQPTDRPVTNGKVDFERIEWLERLIRKHEQNWLRFFKHSGISPLMVSYEEISEWYPRVVRRVLTHLGISFPSDHAIPPPLLRRQADDLTERLVHQYITSQRSSKAMASRLYGLHLG